MFEMFEELMNENEFGMYLMGEKKLYELLYTKEDGKENET